VLNVHTSRGADLKDDEEGLSTNVSGQQHGEYEREQCKCY